MQVYATNGTRAFCAMDDHVERSVLRSIKTKTVRIKSLYNIARVLALYKSYFAAMNKIFIYARLCVNKMTCSAVFFVPFPKYPKIDGNDKKLSRLFLEFSFVLATQSNSKSGDMFRK